jgi:hypothetical protein
MVPVVRTWNEKSVAGTVPEGRKRGEKKGTLYFFGERNWDRQLFGVEK